MKQKPIYSWPDVFSERVKQTESTGDRFEEAKNINKSLMTLGNVIKGIYLISGM